MSMIIKVDLAIIDSSLFCLWLAAPRGCEQADIFFMLALAYQSVVTQATE